MNRPIEFRFWDKKVKRFTYNPYVYNSLINDFFIGVDNDNVIFQQFTGLLDKNGKEIYEGDIVSYCPSNGVSSTIGQISFEFGAFTFTGLKSTRGNTVLFAFTLNSRNGIKALKVIGNIFENPELIK